MIYQLILTPEAERHLDEWRKSVQKKTLLKIAALFEELREHPTTGTGKVEQLKGRSPSGKAFRSTAGPIPCLSRMN